MKIMTVVGRVGILILTLFVSTVYADSMYDQTRYRSLTADIKAQNVGDTLTLLVVENSTANASANSSSRSVMELGGSVGKTDSNEFGSLNTSSGHQGGGRTAREAEVRANITVMVTKKSADGKMYVEGKQRILVNGDEQTIAAKGWLRSEDVAANNTALSSRLGDAVIEYTGEGVLDKSTRQGFLNWLAKFFRLV